MTEQQLLVPLDDLDAVDVFTGTGLDGLLDRIRKEVATQVPDITTAAGRKAIGSLAFKVARSKTAIDDIGKNLVAEWKEKSSRVDAARRRARDTLDEIKDEVRKPLTDWEAEQARIEQEAIDAARIEREAAEAARLAEIERIEAEQQARAAELDRREQEQRDREQAEADRLAAEQADRDRIAREEQIRNEAAEQATRDAAAAVELAEQAAADALERERLAAERAEAERVEAVRQAEERERAAADERENARLAAEAQQRADDAARAADIEHRRKVNVAARDALVNRGLDSEQAQSVITAIIAGHIPAVSIHY